MKTSSKIAIILLAAGGSTRLGRPKQLLEINGEILIQRIYKICTQSQADVVVVVTGSNHNEVEKVIQPAHPVITYNKNWKNGMMSSIQAGLEDILLKQPDTAAVLIVLCDQYFINISLLNTIIQQFKQSDSLAVCCSYDNTIGVPALYSATLFHKLLISNDKKGAKKLLLSLQQTKNVKVLDFPKGKYDIDTINQLENLKQML